MQKARVCDCREAEPARPLPELELLRDVIDAIPVGVIVLDENLRYVLVNQYGAALNGLPASDHIGLGAMEVAPHVFPLVESDYREVFRTGRPITGRRFQAAMATLPGELRWWAANFYPLMDAAGKVTGVCATSRDVTTEVSAKAELQHTMQEMMTILDVVPVGLAIAHDRRCVDVEMNGVYKRMLGLPPDAGARQWDRAYRRKKVRILFNGVEPELEELPLHKAAATGEATEATRLDFTRADGTSISMLARATPLMSDGKIQGAVAAFVDITDLMKIEEQMRKANTVKDDFLAMVSHELRTPMTVILGNAQLLARGHDSFDEDERRSLADDLHREAVGLSRIVENLLLMTRVDRGYQPDQEPVVLDRLCAKVVQDAALHAPDRCRVSWPEEVSVVLGNATSIEQVISNLVSNALKYSPADSMIDLSIENVGEWVLLRVADRGLGIDPADRERIFEPFFRASSSASRSGMGIGLCVCKRLVEAMGGSIWAEPREGGGSVFSLSLRMVDASGV